MQHLSREELLRLLAAARAARERDWLMILVAFQHGLRASEVVSFTRDAVRDGHLTIQRLKGSRKTIQPLRSDQEPLLDERLALEAYCARAPWNQPVFKVTRQRFWQIVQQHGRAAGLEKHRCHPHAMKHSIAQQTIDKAGIHKVQRWLGHKSMNSTAAYLQVTDDAAAEAIARAQHE